jgi:hypothetical protein
MVPLVVDRYELVAELAAGGMATVYVGRIRGAVGFARIVAVKRLHKHLARDAEFVSMFLDEARLASRIRHPNVVPTLDVVSHEGELFLVMEYVHGESLASVRQVAEERSVPIPVPVAAAIVSGMLLGLHAAHEATDEGGQPLNVVHRDVSPQNVLVGADGIARVVDFGISKATGRLQSTTEGQVKGKAGYLAPEQISGEVDRRCDVYAASVVLWELLTGKRLFVGDSPARVLARVIAGDVPRPSSIVPDVPPAIEELVMAGLDRSPDGRFPTAREMDRALRRAVPVASSFEVAEWLAGLMGDSLRARAELVARVEREAAPDGPEKPLGLGATAARDADATAAPTTRERSASNGRRAWVPLAIGAALLGVTAVAAIGARGRKATGSAEPGVSSVASPSAAGDDHAAPVVAAPALAASPEPLAASPPETAQLPPSSPATAASSTRARAAPRRTPNRSSCNPPYTVDSEGHKHFLVDCIH